MDVVSLNLTPYCHLSLPHVTSFSMNVNHQRSQPTLSHCATYLHFELDQYFVEVMEHQVSGGFQ